MLRCAKLWPKACRSSRLRMSSRLLMSGRRAMVQAWYIVRLLFAYVGLEWRGGWEAGRARPTGWPRTSLSQILKRGKWWVRPKPVLGSEPRSQVEWAYKCRPQKLSPEWLRLTRSAPFGSIEPVLAFLSTSHRVEQPRLRHDLQILLRCRARCQNGYFQHL